VRRAKEDSSRPRYHHPMGVSATLTSAVPEPGEASGEPRLTPLGADCAPPDWERCAVEASRRLRPVAAVAPVSEG